MTDENDIVLHALAAYRQGHLLLQEEDLRAIEEEARAGNAPALFIVGAALADSGEKDRARAYFERAARLNYGPALQKCDRGNSAA